MKKKYGESVIITDPGNLGVVMITSENNKINAGDMIKEFNIELVDNYFNRVRIHRNKQMDLN
jgi:glutaminase